MYQTRKIPDCTKSKTEPQHRLKSFCISVNLVSLSTIFNMVVIVSIIVRSLGKYLTCFFKEKYLQITQTFGITEQTLWQILNFVMRKITIRKRKNNCN